MAYSKEEHELRKANRKHTSLSDCFKSSVGKAHNTGTFRSMVSPMLSGIKMTNDEPKNSFVDAMMTDQEDENNYVLDLEMMYGNEVDSNIPNMEKQQRECLKQILVDVTDLSMNEYSMHYISHSSNEYMAPFNDLKSKIKSELFRFYKSSCESIPFKLWSEIIDEHCEILSTFLPISIQKELNEYRLNFVQKYTKNRIKVQLKKFSEKKQKKNKGNKSMQVFSTDAASLDPTLLTDDEYMEMTVSEFINTPFHEYLVSRLSKKSSKNTILSLLCHIKENEIDIMRVYNHNFRMNSKFLAEMSFKDKTIEKYKSIRGFPLQLKPTEKIVYAMEDGVTMSMLEKIKNEKDKEQEQRQRQLQRNIIDSDFSNSFSVDTDSYDEDIPPFCLETEGGRMSNPEKRSSKFNNLCPLKLLKSTVQKDVEMGDDEESKTSEPDQSERPSFGNISDFIKSNMTENKHTIDVSQFSDEASCHPWTSNRKSQKHTLKPSLPMTSMLRFSDLEKMDEDMEVEEMPQKPTFKK